jgi:hypothetical protein
LIYNQNEQICHLDKEYTEIIPYFAEQGENNCVVRSFEPGFRMRLGQNQTKLCESLMLFERENAYILAKRCEDKSQSDPIEDLNRFALLAKKDDGRSLSMEDIKRLQKELKISYQRHYQHLSSIWTCRRVKPMTEEYIPSQLENNGTPIDLESSFINTRVLMLGEAGCGKTTVCQHATYLWACEKIWQSKFEWLFHIKMRNLNSKRYPPLQHKTYSLIDIIERECFSKYALSGLGKLELKSQLANPSNILWILDGWDERKIPDHFTSYRRRIISETTFTSNISTT